MSLTVATCQEIFQDFGLFVRTCGLYRALYQDNQSIQMVEGLANNEISVVTTYILDHVKAAIQAAGSSAKEVLEDLAEQMVEVCSPAQYVLQNTLAQDGAVAADSDNTGDGTLGSVALDQRIPAQRFTAECTDASAAGSEYWKVTGSVSGALQTAQTGVAYEDTNIGLAFTITAGGTDFAVGDKFYFYVTCVERRFQTWFRDWFGVVMPAVATGSETIQESWAA